MMPVPFMRVKSPGHKDWGKSAQMMKFSNATQNNILKLDTGKGVHIVDSAFGVHPDFKSHVGATMIFKGGKGSAINASAKQKLHTESSTTADLVGWITHCLWHCGYHHF